MNNLDNVTLKSVIKELKNLLSETTVSKFIKVEECKFTRQGIEKSIKRVESLIKENKEENGYWIVYRKDTFIASYSINENSMCYSTTYNILNACHITDFSVVEKFYSMNFGAKKFFD